MGGVHPTVFRCLWHLQTLLSMFQAGVIGKGANSKEPHFPPHFWGVLYIYTYIYIFFFFLKEKRHLSLTFIYHWPELCHVATFATRKSANVICFQTGLVRQGKNSTVCHSYQVGFGKLISISSMSYGKSLFGDM